MATISASAVKELREKTGVGMMDCKKALLESDGDLEKAVKYLREKGLAAASKKAERSANEGQVFIAINDAGNQGVILELNCETDFVASNDGFRSFGSTLAQTVLMSSIDSVDAIESLSVEGKSFTDAISEAVLKLGENIQVKRFERVSTEGSLASYIHMNGKIGVLINASGALDAELGRDIAMHAAAAAPLYTRPDEVPTSELDAEKDMIRNQALNEGRPEQVVDKIVEGKISKYYKEVCLLEQSFVKDPDNTVAQILPEGVTIQSFIRYALG